MNCNNSALQYHVHISFDVIYDVWQLNNGTDIYAQKLAALVRRRVLGHTIQTFCVRQPSGFGLLCACNIFLMQCFVSPSKRRSSILIDKDRIFGRVSAFCTRKSFALERLPRIPETKHLLGNISFGITWRHVGHVTTILKELWGSLSSDVSRHGTNDVMH